MGKKSSLAAPRRAQIVVLRDESYSESGINVKVVFRKTSVHTAFMNFQKSGTFNYKERRELPSKKKCLR